MNTAEADLLHVVWAALGSDPQTPEEVCTTARSLGGWVREEHKRIALSVQPYQAKDALEKFVSLGKAERVSVTTRNQPGQAQLFREGHYRRAKKRAQKPKPGELFPTSSYDAKRRARAA